MITSRPENVTWDYYNTQKRNKSRNTNAANYITFTNPCKVKDESVRSMTKKRRNQICEWIINGFVMNYTFYGYKHYFSYWHQYKKKRSSTWKYISRFRNVTLSDTREEWLMLTLNSQRTDDWCSAVIVTLAFSGRELISKNFKNANKVVYPFQINLPLYIRSLFV